MSDPANEHNKADDIDSDNLSDSLEQAERTVEQDLDELAQQNAELQSKLLRAHADYQNFARRSQLNVQAARDQQTGDVARDLLPVLDQFDAAMSVDPAKATMQSLLQGITMVREELMRSLSKHGIVRITAKKGDDFDPTRHEAMMRQKADGVASNHIVAQLQPGYMLGERTLRPVKVSVAE